MVTAGTLTGGSNNLTIDAGTAGVVTTNAFSGVDSFTLLDAASATFAAASDATTVDLNLTTGGAITFNGLVTATTLTTDADDAGVAGALPSILRSTPARRSPTTRTSTTRVR